MAIWIPFFWMFFAGSRFASQWLRLGNVDASGFSVLDGSPLDRAFFLALMFAGVLVLLSRKVDWKTVFFENKWVWLYFVFGAVSFAWSDYPFVSFKRWIKALGNVVMVLIVLTEEQPYVAIGVILRRLAFLLLPLSVLFIKYYPNLGRGYHMGEPMFIGVSSTKNGLGAMCMLASIYFSWSLLFKRGGKRDSGGRLRYWIYLIMIPMTAWLLYKADSATSLSGTVFAIGFFLLATHRAFVREPRKLIPFVVACAAFIGIVEISFGIKEYVVTLLGRRPDLTTRVPMWEDLLSMVRNPLLGHGFESFWLGERLESVQGRWGDLLQAHNGYLEMYLNMGIVGVLFVVLWFLSGIKNAYRYLLVDRPAAILRFCFVGVIALCNYTEASFSGVSNMWMLLFLGIMDTPKQSQTGTPKSQDGNVTERQDLSGR